MKEKEERKNGGENHGESESGVSMAYVAKIASESENINTLKASMKARKKYENGITAKIA